MKALILGSSILILTAVGLAFGGWVRLSDYLGARGPASEERVVVIPEGADALAVVDLLEREQLVARPDWLRFYVKNLARPLEIHPGEYAFSRAMAPLDFLEKASAGKVVTYKVTIPAGATAREIVDLLAKEKLGDPEALALLVEDARFASELGVPSVSLEGFLFPDTYEIARGLSPKMLLTILVGRYKRVVTTGILDAARASGLEERELITLASLIEKSAVPENEQRTFSALLHNRLAEEMPLEVRASLVYGLAKKGLTVETAEKADLKTRWNTEDNPGLPPGPIASPSLAAIVAAAEPARSKAIYMVRRSDGAHVFCPDIECQQAAIKEWNPEHAEKTRR